MKIRSADLLISGKILNEVCVECVPEILDAGQLTPRDVDALFIFLTYSTYGAEKRFSVGHMCSDPKKRTKEYHDYSISLDSIVGKPNNDCLEHRDLMYTTTISTGQRVNLKPSTFEESLKILDLQHQAAMLDREGEKVPNSLVEQMVLTDIMAIIKSVEDKNEEGESFTVDNPIHVKEWLKSLSRLDTEHIIKTADDASEWGFQFDIKLNCRDCGEEFTHELELNPINFFSG